MDCKSLRGYAGLGGDKLIADFGLVMIGGEQQQRVNMCGQSKRIQVNPT